MILVQPESAGLEIQLKLSLHIKFILLESDDVVLELLHATVSVCLHPNDFSNKALLICFYVFEYLVVMLNGLQIPLLLHLDSPIFFVNQQRHFSIFDCQLSILLD